MDIKGSSKYGNELLGVKNEGNLLGRCVLSRCRRNLLQAYDPNKNSLNTGNIVVEI
jgi:hypothetical protein